MEKEINLKIMPDQLDEFIGCLIDSVEYFLGERGIDLPNEKNEDTGAVISGSNYDDLRSRFETVCRLFGSTDSGRLCVNTPAGIITAERMPDKSHPGIFVCNGSEPGEPGVIVEYDPQAFHDTESLILARVYNIDDPDGDPAVIERLSRNVRENK